MAAKRQAISDLNHDNWDKEEEPEDPGQFREASTDELKNRVIKKARRRIAAENNGDSPNSSKSIFSGFSGFASGSTATAPTAKATPFAFLSKLPTSTTSATITTANTSITTTATSTIPTFSFGNVDSKTDKNASDVKSKGDNACFSKIMKLNKSFCDWIVQNVNEQPLCNLTPTFKDYEKFMQEILAESKEESSAKTTSTALTASPAVVTAATTSSTSTTPLFSNFKFNATSPTEKATGFGITAPVKSAVENTNVSKEKTAETESVKSNGSVFSFGIKPAEKTNGNTGTTSTSFSFGQTKANGKSEAETSKASAPFNFSGPANTQSKSDTSGFSFGLKNDTAKPAATSGFSFGLKKEDAPSTSGFSFMSGGTPFNFANIKPPAAEPPKEGNAEDDDEDEPPKVEVKEIVEEDALYTKRCKVFVKKDNAYKDHGIGTFYLKPVKDSDKTQLLVRSSNNLGTILINVILVDGMPTQRMGKNNVMLVHPGSTDDAKLQTTLFRVKDGTEADELLEMINKHKK